MDHGNGDMFIEFCLETGSPFRSAVAGFCLVWSWLRSSTAINKVLWSRCLNNEQPLVFSLVCSSRVLSCWTYKILPECRRTQPANLPIGEAQPVNPATSSSLPSHSWQVHHHHPSSIHQIRWSNPWNHNSWDMLVYPKKFGWNSKILLDPKILISTTSARDEKWQRNLCVDWHSTRNPREKLKTRNWKRETETTIRRRTQVQMNE